MKRTILLSALMILLILTMIGSVIFLNNPELLQPKKSERNPESDNLEYAYCAVITNDIVHRYNTTGQVISGAPSVYIDDVTVQIGERERYTVAVAKGDEIVPGQLLCTVDGNDYVSDIEAKVVAVDLHDESGTQLTISLLNYGKLVILASVDYGILDQIDYETPVDLTINGVTYQSFFSDIGYEIRGGTVDVLIPVPSKCLPGTKVDISVVCVGKRRDLEAAAVISAVGDRRKKKIV